MIHRLSLVLSCALLACSGEPPKTASNAAPLVNGEVSPFSMIPAAGALVVDVPGSYHVFCTGTLVGEKLVLTAAHCFGSLPAGTPFGFYAGVSIKPSDPSPAIAPAVSVHKAPSFAGGDPPKWIDNFNDIALVKLKVNPAVKPARLVRPQEVDKLVKAGGGVMLVGYGHTVAGVKDSAGVKHHGVSTIGEIGAHELHVLGAGAPQKCHGDSGGPTLGDLDTTTGYDWRVIGVTSRSDVNCKAGTIETRVDAHLSWIHQVGGSAIPCGSGQNPDCPAPAKKGLGDPCQGNDECEDQLCVPLAEGNLCSRRCVLEQKDPCPVGFICIPIIGADDGACIPLPPPPKKKLLSPCVSGEECEGGVCGWMQGKRFCTALCDPEVGCAALGDDLVCVLAEDGPHACVPSVLTEPGDDGGCTVAAGQTPSPAGSPALMLFLLYLALRRRGH